MRLSIVSGGFDPLHIGHLELLERSAAIADKLFVIVNTDQFLANKKGKPFMPLRERMMIVQALKPVNLTIKSIDEDHTVCASLKFVNEMYRNKFDKIMFCGGQSDPIFHTNFLTFLKMCLEQNKQAIVHTAASHKK